jgi:hypothetical protein
MSEIEFQRQAFLLYMETERCASYGFDAWRDVDLHDWQTRNFAGRPLAPDWKLPKHTLFDLGLPLFDFIYGYSEAPFVSERVSQVLASAAGATLEFRPLGRLKETEYYVMNVLLLADCLDTSKSEIMYSPDDHSRIIGVDSFVFHRKSIPDSLVFKVPQYTGKIFATMRLVDLVRQYRWTGVGFEDPARIGFSLINRVFDDLPFH